MNAPTSPKFLEATATVDEAAVKPLPNSRKVYIQGTRADIRVPMREISQSDTPLAMSGTGKGEPNPAIFVYDTSGPYTDPAVTIDIRSGLAPLREKWIEERNDTILLAGPSSQFGVERLNDAKLNELRFNLKRHPRVAKAGANVSQMHYAKRGIVTPEMEYIAIRENQNRTWMLANHPELITKQHPGESFGANIQSFITPEFVRDEVARGRAHPGQHQSPRI